MRGECVSALCWPDRDEDDVVLLIDADDVARFEPDYLSVIESLED
jgi:hypothetical protein